MVIENAPELAHGHLGKSSVSSKKEEPIDCSRKSELNRTGPDFLLYWGCRRISLKSPHGLLREQEPSISLATLTSLTEQLLTLCLCHWKLCPEHPTNVTSANKSFMNWIQHSPYPKQPPDAIIERKALLWYKVTKAPWNFPNTVQRWIICFKLRQVCSVWPVLPSTDITPLSFFSTNSCWGLRFLLQRAPGMIWELIREM